MQVGRFLRILINHPMKTTHLLLCAFLALLLSAFFSATALASNPPLHAQAASSPVAPSPDPSQDRPYDAWAEYLHTRMLDLVASHNLPNAVIALVSSDRIHFLHGYGQARMDEERAVDPTSDLFRVGSTSKALVWSAVMHLHESGQLALDADIRDYLDMELSYRTSYGQSEAHVISLYHLMSHTAGFANTFEGLFSFSPLPTLADYLQAHEPPLLYPPGQVMAYSNYGTALAAYIVECVSGLPFEEYADTYILKPLGMEQSSFEQVLPDYLQDHMVNSYRFVDGEFLQGRFEYMVAPAGGLSTTARDMGLFMMAHLNGGRNYYGRILQSETVKFMHSPLFRHHPRLTGMAQGLWESERNGLRIIEHGGSTTIFDSGLYLLPELDLGLFIAYSGGTYYGHSHILADFLDEFFPHKEDPLAEPPEANYVAGIDELPGEYGHSLRIATGLDQLINHAFGSMRVSRQAKDELSIWVYDQTFVFRKLSPGVYENTEASVKYPYGLFRYLITDRAPDGRLMLVTDGPATFIRLPWYQRTSFLLLVLIPALLLSLGSLLFFVATFLIRKLRRQKSESASRRMPAKGILLLHSLSYVIFVFLLLSYFQPDPVHLMSASFFGELRGVVFLLGVAAGMAAMLALLLVGSTLRAWYRGSSGLAARTFLSIYSLWALAQLWLFLTYDVWGF